MERVETDVEFLQRMKREITYSRSVKGNFAVFTTADADHLHSLAEAGRQQQHLQSSRVCETCGRPYLALTAAPPSAPVLPEPFKHPQCPRCRSLPPLRMLQQVPLIWICDCCTQAFNGELKPWSIADAVLPEPAVTPLEQLSGCIDFGGILKFDENGDEYFEKPAVLPEGQPQNEKEFRARYLNEWPVSDTSGEGK